MVQMALTGIAPLAQAIMNATILRGVGGALIVMDQCYIQNLHIATLAKSMEQGKGDHIHTGDSVGADELSFVANNVNVGIAF